MLKFLHEKSKVFFIATRNPASYVLILLILLFIVQRLGLLLFGFSHIFHPLIDEPVSGTLARDFLYGGLRAPLFVYQYVSHSGDVLIEGLLLIPFHKIFGSSIFSTKIFALCSAFFTLACWLVTIKRYQGIWAAVIFAAFYAFPPPLFARLNLVGAVSSHHMINPIIALQLLCLFMMVERDTKGGGTRISFFFGLLAGFGTYVFYSYIIFNAYCIVFLFIFRNNFFPVRRIFFFITGAAVGLTPWVVRASSAPKGTSFSYLQYLFNNLSVVYTNLIHSFFYNIPHSLSYATPSRSIGSLSIFLCLFMLICLIVILVSFSNSYCSLKINSLKKKLLLTDDVTFQQLFCALFPLFFLACLSVSPKQINPFEYVPNFGIFPTFYPTDVIRYRWLFMLFPFYFAICAFGTITLHAKYAKDRLMRTTFIGIVVFFIVCGILKSFTMYSKNDYGKIFAYKGYSHDLMTTPFILGDMASPDLRDAELIIKNYPEENKPSAYQSFGTKVAFSLLQKPDKEEELKSFIEKVPASYLGDFIYGIVMAAEIVSEQQFTPCFRFLAARYPTLFYTIWGFRHLAHTNYGTLINVETLLQNIPPAEQWFFKDFLEEFQQEVNTSDKKLSQEKLLKLICNLEPENRYYTIKGLGKAIGAEMLFDPLSVIDYPLDSRIGQLFSGSEREYFYEGIGNGFAETLCRFWRSLLPPEEMIPEYYEKMLDVEWQRCKNLFNKMPVELHSTIKKGFVTEMQQRHLGPIIKKYLEKKLVDQDGDAL